MTTELESALVQAARLGDRQAFEQLYRQTFPYVMNNARRLLRNEAEDLVQSTYLRAFTSIAAFRGECGILTWLHTILRNQAATRMRPSHIHSTECLLDSFEAPQRNYNVAIDLERALKVLSVTEQQLIAFSLQGYRDSEIAGKLGLLPTQSTMRVRRWRAHRKMQAALTGKA